ncbi:MAG: hypothetical protein QNJ09_08275 [Paracoccaceae bacterium]|nr:hypothetical protein [Paracoccaceae bacterium]
MTGKFKTMREHIADCLRSGLAGEELASEVGLELPDPSMRAWSGGEEGVLGKWRRMPAGDFAVDPSLDCLPDAWKWARIPRILPKEGRRRILLLGESVARGYFYDPKFTPALVLERMLARVWPEGVDVVDLAAVDLGVGTLIDLLIRCGDLDPDMLVIFAGNNWLENALSRLWSVPRVRFQAAGILANGGSAELDSHMIHEAETLIGEDVETISRLLDALSMPTVVIVPEFNLADWRDTGSGECPAWLPRDDNFLWAEASRKAEEAFRTGAPEIARNAACAMSALDRGTSSRGARFLADSGSAGAQTTRRLRAAMTAGIGLGRRRAPRCTPFVQDRLRSLAGGKTCVVDLPGIFEAGGSDNSDERFFLDYCHLSSRGIKVAMGACAKAFVQMSGAPLSSIELRVEPGEDVEALAYLLAGIHCAHWQQPNEILDAFFSRAFADSPEARKIGGAICQLQGGATPGWLVNPPEICGDTGPQSVLAVYFDMLRHDSRASFLDTACLDRIAHALKAHDVDATRALAARRVSDWSTRVSGRLNILDRSRRDHFFDRSWPGRDRQFYRVYEPIVQFHFEDEGRGPRRLRLVIRSSPFAIPSGCFNVYLNGTRIGSEPLQAHWGKFSIDFSSLRRGRNTLSFKFPSVKWSTAEALSGLEVDLKRGRNIRLLEFFPSYADIQCLDLAEVTPYSPEQPAN